MKKLLLLTLALFINCSISNAQYSLFSHKNNKKSKSKKEVVKSINLIIKFTNLNNL